MRRIAAILALLYACGHSDGYLAVDPTSSDGPFVGGPIVRLTYEPGMDLYPSWSPDGSLLVYAFQPAGRADHDRCIGVLPGTGGTRVEHCYNAIDGDRRTDALEWPAVGAGGALVYTHYVSDIGARIPERGVLRLGTLDEPLRGGPLMTLPATVGAVGFTRIGQTAWNAPGRFLFVAQDYLMLGNIANGNKKDTTYVGVALVQATLTAGGAQFSVVPGTDSATTFVLSPAADSRLGRFEGGIYLDVRNVLNKRNQTSVRRDTGSPFASEATIDRLALVAYNANPDPIPFESPRYRRSSDLDSNGLIAGQAELLPLYRSAARDFTQPLFVYGPPRTLRFGLEMLF